MEERNTNDWTLSCPGEEEKEEVVVVVVVVCEQEEMHIFTFRYSSKRADRLHSKVPCNRYNIVVCSL